MTTLKKGQKHFFRNATYRKLLFIFLFDNCAVIIAHWRCLVGVVEAVFALASIAAAAESEPGNVHALREKQFRTSVMLSHRKG